MPITADLNGKNYTLGRGKLYFAQFSADQVSAGIGAATMPANGSKYLGNTPEISMTSSEESLDHFDSDQGVRTKDDSVSLQLDRTGSFTCDNISKENWGMTLLAAGVTAINQTSATASIYLTGAVKRDRFYQIGATESLPTGVREISNVVVNKGSPGFATVVAASGNYQVDELRGRIYIMANATDIPEDTELQITYDQGAGVRDQIVAGSSAIYGALHYVADNPKGTNRDIFWPYVKLAPDGDLALKGDDWMTMGFTFEALKKATSIATQYVDGMPT